MENRRLNVCVFCGSGKDIPSSYVELAREFGKKLAENKMDLVWGGCTTSMMGSVAEGAQEGGGKVIGIVPFVMKENGIAYEKADELVLVADLTERKQKMRALSDAFVVLPGGIGTLDEFISMLTEQHIDARYGKKHRKNIILNLNGFYDPLVALLDHFYEGNFADVKYRELYTVVSTIDGVIAELASTQS